jgi:glycosyltransferase involved in cell wall biosynthesis
MTADVGRQDGETPMGTTPAGGAASPESGGTGLRVGLVAPPWLPVPPATYGGTESFVDVLARGLVATGHAVRLFATGHSTCPVDRSWFYPEGVEPIGMAVFEAAHVQAAYEVLDDCDVIHDNTTLGPMWAAAVRHPTPIVLTYHGEFSPQTIPLYAVVARWCGLTAISHSQRASAPEVPFAGVVHHGIEADRFTPGDGSGGYAMFLGRLAPEKGAAEAIEIARRAGMPLRIAAKMREQPEKDYFAEFVEPHLGPDVEFLGEVDPEERERQLGGAVALLNPISWAEPFGLVMIEAMACGTPVVGFPSGAAPEIVVDGTTGFLCDGVTDAADALTRVGGLDRAACRRHVETAFSAKRMVADYVQLYHDVLERRPERTS